MLLLLWICKAELLKTGIFGKAAAEQAAATITRNATTATAQKIAVMTTELNVDKQALIALEAKIAATEEEAVAIETAIAAKRAKIIATEAEIVATEAATVATEELNVATKFSPIGGFLLILSLLIPAIAAYASTSSKAAEGTKKWNSTTGDAITDSKALEAEIGNLTNKISPLLDQYDSLKSKTNLSTDEQTKLKDIIKQIAEAMPGAVTAYDNLGNAIAISTDRVREYIKTEQDRLKVVNGNAIKEYNDQLDETN